jgi:hypothetical protein
MGSSAQRRVVATARARLGGVDGSGGGDAAATKSEVSFAELKCVLRYDGARDHSWFFCFVQVHPTEVLKTKSLLASARNVLR